MVLTDFGSLEHFRVWYLTTYNGLSSEQQDKETGKDSRGIIPAGHYCVHLKTTLASAFPDVAAQRHPTTNEYCTRSHQQKSCGMKNHVTRRDLELVDVKPETVTTGSNRKVWWRCDRYARSLDFQANPSQDSEARTFVSSSTETLAIKQALIGRVHTDLSARSVAVV